MLREKVGRNDPCHCGSGLKYKKCCLNNGVRARWGNTQALPAQDRAPRGSFVPHTRWTASDSDASEIRLKSTADVARIRDAGRLVIDTLDHVKASLEAGMSTDDINTLVHTYTIERGAIPAPLGYKGFPKSTCVSVNEVVLHGIPGTRILHDGDIVNVDVTSILNGYYADASQTFFVGEPGPEARRIVEVARQSLLEGISMVRPDNTTGDIGWAIQTYAEGQGCSVVRDWSGHGVGFGFHEDPVFPHHGSRGSGVRLVPGMVFTIEPMINQGRREIKFLDDGWTLVTCDGSLSAQFEQTLLVTPDGVESLTPYDLV